MPVSGGTIVAPVNGNDPYDLLGVPKQPSGYDVGYICSNGHGRINMWAKYKPVRHINVINVNDTQRDSVNWGLYIPHENGTPDNIYNASWGTNAPRGGSNEPYRITDFDNYNHHSTFPLTGWLKKEDISINKSNPNVIIQLALLQPTQKYNLQILDSVFLSSLRLAVKISPRYDTSKSWIITSDNTAGVAVKNSGILQVNIDFSFFDTFSTSAFTATQFLTTASYPSISTFPTIIPCYSVPNYWGIAYTNRINIEYSKVEAGLDIIADGLSNSLWGTYNTEEYYFINPFLVYRSSYEYWKLTIENRGKEQKTIAVTDLIYQGSNVNGDDTTSQYSDIMKLYNSNRVEAYSITIPSGTTVDAYVRTQLFSQNASFNSGMNAITVICYALYTNTYDNIVNREVARFEARIKGQI